MAEENRWRESQINIPSLLPLQSVPQEPDTGKILNYLQALHNYLADDRLKIARALNIVNYYRYVSGEQVALDRMVASDSKTLRVNETSLFIEVDSAVPTGTPAWHPLIGSSSIVPGLTNVVSEAVLINNAPMLNFGDDVVVPTAAPTTPSELDQPSEFLWTVDGDIVMALVEV